MAFGADDWRAVCRELHAAAAAGALYFRAAAMRDRAARGAVPPAVVDLEDTAAYIMDRLAVALDRLSGP